MTTNNFILAKPGQPYENAVFVSYAWGGESERTVDQLEKSFLDHGIRIVRDKKDLGYKGSIETFEQRIGRGQCIILIISDKYLRSEHCMFELVEISKNRNLRERIFPVVLEDARIYRAIDRLSYIKHWNDQIDQLNQAIKEVGVMTNLTGIAADLDKYAKIRASFDHLTDLLSDMNALTLDTHTADGFSILISEVVRKMSESQPIKTIRPASEKLKKHDNSMLTIVVADDIEEVVDATVKDINMLAQKHGKNIKVLKAITGSDVIYLSENERVDAFYLDYMFEYGMTGDEIIRSITDPFETKFFVLMSGWKEEVLENIITKNHHLLKARCRFLRKPFDMLSLQATFLDILSFFDTRPYPLPIQYAFESVLNSSGIAKALALKDFYETLLRFSVSILMADLSRQGYANAFKANLNLHSHLSYDTLLEWLVKLIELYKGKEANAFLPELITFYTEMDSINPLRIIDEFKQLKNNGLDFGYTKDDEWYETLASNHEGSFILLCKNLRFLSRYTLIFPEKIEFLPGEAEGYQYQVKSLMGTDMIPGKIDLVTSSRLPLNSSYLHSPLGDMLNLSPFMSYKICSKCNERKLFFLDRIQPAHIIYKSFCNHDLEDREAKAQLIQKYPHVFSDAG